ncbi:MAG: peptidase [Roseiflexaceae bacterium]
MSHQRRSSMFTRLSLLIIVMLATTWSFGSAAQARTKAPVLQRPTAPRMISSAQDGVKPAAKRGWTKAEMLAAKPYPEPKVKRTAQIEATKQTRPNGPAGSIPAKKPNSLSIESFPVNPGSYSSFPYSAVGKLFFTQYGVNYVCSGALVKGQAFWTAGHCAHAGNNDPNGWSYNAVFVPQYYYGSAPLGYCYVQNWWTNPDWYANGNPNGLDHDYAGGNVSCDIADITSYTGYLGLAWNQSYYQSWSALGYPQAAPFDGGSQIQCDSGTALFDFGTPTTFGINCNMTGGASGGPFVIWGSYINGNSSYKYGYLPNLLFSPYLDGDAYTLWTYLWN